jgi:hypothetical protein
MREGGNPLYAGGGVERVPPARSRRIRHRGESRGSRSSVEFVFHDPARDPIRPTPRMANNSAGTKLGAASHPKILSLDVVPFQGGRSMASEYRRYGYRRITALLRAEGYLVNHKRVERIWRAEGLKLPAKQPKRRRLWLGDGSCIRLRPTHRNHVWAYHFVMDRTAAGRSFRMLTIVDEFTRECLAIDVARKLTS